MEEKDIFDFIEELRTLCNTYGVELSGCDCGALVVNDVTKPIEEFEIDLDEETGGLHLTHVYAKLVLTA